MKILVTGGAGFIGSNLVEALLQSDQVTLVRVIDNLATGNRKNIADFLSNPKFEFIEADIRDYEACLQACSNIDILSHQAALGSVPRSINDPVTTNAVNITGTLNMFTAAKEQGIKKVIYAASSSTYGDSKSLPKVEDVIGKPLSPYAVTKLVNELYADVFHRLYGMDFIGLRYFNVFGPKQNPAGPYAAVIPLFAEAALNQQNPFINGDGEQSRDFTFVANTVDANLNAIFATRPAAWNQVYNVACGQQHTINELFTMLKNMAGHPHLEAQHRDSREGDVRHSLADINKARTLLGYNPRYSVSEGLEITLQWYKEHANYFRD